jgi:hypothetical protein
MNLYESLKGQISETEITCFIGAGDMDLYFNKLFDEFEADSLF